MNRRLLIPVLGLLLLGGAASRPVPLVAADSCGITPIKPIPPIGCTDLQPVCSCDAAGKNCRWTWACVK